MYLLVNPDMTINVADNHPISNVLNREGLTLIEFPDKSLDDMVGDIPLEEAMWDEAEQQVIFHPYFAVGSAEWRRQQASIKINHYYPVSKQLNLYRSGDKAAIKTMARFIDRCRQWSNDLSSDPSLIAHITP